MGFTTDMLAGEGYAGFALPQEDPAQSLAYPAKARQFDGKTGGYTLTSEGHWTESHPVDQGVALSLCFRKGSIKSAPDVGHTLHLVRLGTARTRAEVEDRVKNAFPLSSYLAAGLVRIVEIAHEERPSGGLFVAVGYINEAEPGQKRTQTATI